MYVNKITSIINFTLAHSIEKTSAKLLCLFVCCLFVFIYIYIYISYIYIYHIYIYIYIYKEGERPATATCFLKKVMHELGSLFNQICFI